MIQTLQPKISHDRHKHPDGLENVRQISNAARGGNGRPQQIVKAENVDHVEILQPRTAVSLDRRIPAHRAVTQPGRQINSLDAIFIAPPAEGRAFCRDLSLRRLHAFFQAPVCRQHTRRVASSSQSFREGANFDWRAAKFQEGSVRFCDVQDSHCSRRIFFKDFAKTLKRNSRSTRWRPRAPISRAWAGSARSASIEVAR